MLEWRPLTKWKLLYVDLKERFQPITTDSLKVLSSIGRQSKIRAELLSKLLSNRCCFHVKPLRRSNSTHLFRVHRSKRKSLSLSTSTSTPARSLAYCEIVVTDFASPSRIRLHPTPRPSLRLLINDKCMDFKSLQAGGSHLREIGHALVFNATSRCNYILSSSVQRRKGRLRNKWGFSSPVD